MTPFNLALIVFAAINLFSFYIMMTDKLRARRNDNDRHSEGFLFFLGVMFGAAGIYAGMMTFRHKTKKWYFMLTMPMLIAQNIATLYLLFQYWQV